MFMMFLPTIYNLQGDYDLLHHFTGWLRQSALSSLQPCYQQTSPYHRMASAKMTSSKKFSNNMIRTLCGLMIPVKIRPIKSPPAPALYCTFQWQMTGLHCTDWRLETSQELTRTLYKRIANWSEFQFFILYPLYPQSFLILVLVLV